MIKLIRYHLAEMLFSFSYFIQDLAETVGGYPGAIG
jgi:hypothetical protein